MKKIKIRIGRDGTQSIEVIGAQGDECVAFTAALEARLGKREGKRKVKPEFDSDGDVRAVDGERVEGEQELDA